MSTQENNTLGFGRPPFRPEPRPFETPVPHVPHHELPIHLEMHIHHEPHPHGLIHNYNKVCFKSFNEAVNLLCNKEILPGEVSFAYYFDRNSSFGISAIAAVGNLKKDAGNIIIPNIEYVNKVKEALEEDIDDTNADLDQLINSVAKIDKKSEELTGNVDKLERYVKQMQSDFDQVLSGYDTSIQDIIDLVNKTIEELKSDSDEKDDVIIEINSSINEISSAVEDLVDDVNDMKNDISTLEDHIKEIGDNLSGYVDEVLGDAISAVESSIIDYTNNTIGEAIGNAVSEVKDIINTLESSMYEQFDTIDNKIDESIEEMTEYVDSINSSLQESISDLQEYVDEQISSIIDAFGGALEDIESSIISYVDSADASLNEKIDSANEELLGSINSIKLEFLETLEDSLYNVSTAAHDEVVVLKNYVDVQDKDLCGKISDLAVETETAMRSLSQEFDWRIYNTSLYLENLIKKENAELYSYIDIKEDQLNTTINDKEQLVYQAICDVSKAVHALEDGDASVARYAESLNVDTKAYVNNEVLAPLTDGFTDLSTNLNIEIARQRTFLKDFTDQEDASVAKYITRSLDTLKTTIDTSIIFLTNRVMSADSAITARINTINTKLDSSFKEMKSTLNDMLFDYNNKISSARKSEDASLKNYIDNNFVKSTNMPQTLIANTGVRIDNGTIKLMIDDNGILTVGSKKYKLTPFTY